MSSNQSEQSSSLSLAYHSDPAMVCPDFNTIYSFGSQTGKHYGELIFEPEGGLYGLKSDSECRWIREGSELCLLNSAGNITSRFRYITSNIWRGHVENRGTPLYLLPLINTDPWGNNGEYGCSGFLVNSIPKSGTYFLEAALKNAGIPSLRLHLSGIDIIDDFRKLRDEEVHVNPELCRVNAPVHLVTKLLKGRAAVGHIESLPMLDRIRQQNVCIFNLRRNLRDVLVSLYRFKYKKVKPISAKDRYWREMSEQSRFIAFLMAYSECDIAHIKAIATMMLMDTASIPIRYEQMCENSIDDAVKTRLNAVKTGFAEVLSDSFTAQYGKENPTFSGCRSDWKEYWSEDAERYFTLSGLREINARSGYE